MDRGPGGGQLRILTCFLVAALMVTTGSLLLGGAGSDGEASAGPMPPPTEQTTEPASTTSTRPPTTATPPDPATTTLPSTNARALDDPTPDPAPADSPPTTSEGLNPEDDPVLLPKDEEAISIEAAPSVGFITTPNGTGSGVLVAEDLIVTNAHVVWPFRSVGVTFPGDTKRSGTVLGVDPRADLAVIRVDSKRLPLPMQLGSIDDVAVEEAVYIVGYPAAGDVDIDAAQVPTVEQGVLRSVEAWEFSGMRWAHVEAPARAGQSGGALIDRFGRLVGITTFGNSADLYAIAADDLDAAVDRLSQGSLAGVEKRRPPTEISSRRHPIDLEGPWDQAIFVAWLGDRSTSNLDSTEQVRWRALDPFGVEMAVGTGSLTVDWRLASPGVVLAEADAAVETTMTVDLPLVPVDDPDDGRIVTGDEPFEGFVDVPGDRDFLYLDTETDGPLRIVAESQTRVRLELFDRRTGELLGRVVHRRGFLFPEPALEVAALPAGSYVVAVEDIGSQYGTYRLTVDD